jgi:hypothetical protein
MKRRRLWVCLLGGLVFVLRGACEPARQITLERYAKELDRLQTVVDGCSHELLSKAAAQKACDPTAVGPDEMVSVATGKRIVSYDWLRDTLREAAQNPRSDQNALKQAVTELSEAGTRLQQMTQQMVAPRTGIYVPANVSNMHAKLATILDSGDYPQAKQPSFLQRMWNEFVRWLRKALAEAMPRGSPASAIYLLEFTVIAIPCGLLVWWFVRRLRVQSLDLAGNNALPASAPSSQDWQEWLAQGQRLGSEGRWREAIHHLYWGSISCLESRHLWSADRARTPREYLQLLNGNAELHADLFSLTEAFEHTWYGETPAAEKDFHQACTVLERITAR